MQKLSRADAILLKASEGLTVLADRLATAAEKLPSHELRGKNDVAEAVKAIDALSRRLFGKASGHEDEVLPG